MSDTQIRAPRAIDLLKSDHERAQTLFSEYEKFGDDSALTRQGIFEQILRELAVHARIEEEVFYPAVAQLGGLEDAGARVDEALDEHLTVRALLAELSTFAPDSREFDAQMQALEESVERHATEEERRLFPLFGKLPSEKQDEVSETLWRMRNELSEGETGVE